MEIFDKVLNKILEISNTIVDVIYEILLGIKKDIEEYRKIREENKEKERYLKSLKFNKLKDEVNKAKHLSLEKFKICVTPLKGEEVKAGRIRELRLGFEEGLTIQEVELYKKEHLSIEDMRNVREFIIKTKADRDINYGNLEEEISRYSGKELKAFLDLEEQLEAYKKNDMKYVINDKEKFEEMYSSLPKEELRKIILTEDLVLKIQNEDYQKFKDIAERGVKVEYNLEIDDFYDDNYDYNYISEHFSSILNQEDTEQEETIKKESNQNSRIDFRSKEDKEQEIEK